MKKLSLYKKLMTLFWILIPVFPMIYTILFINSTSNIIGIIFRIIWFLIIFLAMFFTFLYQNEKKTQKNTAPVQNAPAKKTKNFRNAANSAEKPVKIRQETDMDIRNKLLGKYRSAVADRFPQEIFEYETFRALFENLKNVIDAVYVMITATGNPFDKAEKSTEGIKVLSVSLVDEMNQFLEVVNDERIIKSWSKCSDEQLIDAFILFDFYSEVIQNMNIDNVKYYRDYLAQELYNRFEKNKASENENKSVASGRKELAEDEGINFVNGLEKVFVMFSTATGKRYPSVDMNGFAWVFSKVEFAEYSRHQNAAYNLDFYEMTLQEFKSFVKEWYAYGVYQFRLNPGINDAYSEIQRDKFVPDANAKMFDYYCSNFNQLILRFKQMRACENNSTLAFSQTLWSSICHELYKNVFLVPVSFDGEPDDAKDNFIHYSDNARKMINQMEANREFADELKAGESLEVKGDVIIANEKLILGSDGYKYLSPDDSTARVMHLRTLTNGAISMLCAFTDIRDMHRIFGENLHIAMMTYEDIIAHINDPISDGNTISGLIINAGANEFTLSRENIELAEKESKESVKLYM